jgi:biopolymer transport protein ExbD
MISKHQARALIRKAVKRVPEGEEIRHLNIMPMMDMMTILLVTMIFQAASASALSIGDVDLPFSRSQEQFPESAVTLTIAKQGIFLDGNKVVGVNKQGSVDASEKKGGALGLKIMKLSKLLGAVRIEFEHQLRQKGKVPKEVPELFIVADRSTNYRLLFEVIASARAEEAGYKRFRLIVLEQPSKGAE